MPKFCFKTLLLSLILLLWGNAALHSKPAVIVSRVNNQIITLKELDSRVQFEKNHNPLSKTLSKKSLIYNTLDDIIEEAMISQEAQRVGMEISQEELEAIMSRVKHGQPKLYKKLDSSEKEILRNKIKTNLIWSKILVELVKPSINQINNPQIIETLEHLDKDTEEFKFNISQIKIKNSKNNKLMIEKLHQELVNNDETKDVLEIYKEQGILFDFQDIGWVSKSTLDKKIYKVLMADKGKTYTKPILFDDNLVMFKIKEKIFSNNISKKDYEIAQREIYESLKISDGEGFLTNLRKRTFIEIYSRRIDQYMNL